MEQNNSIAKVNEYPTKERLFFLDVLKAISIIAVVSYHSIFVPQSTYETSFFWIELLFAPLRFCVPVLLTISFLLSERSLRNRQADSGWLPLKKRLVRLAIPTGFWFGVAVILKLLKHNSWIEIWQEICQGEIFLGAYYLLIMFQLTIVFFGLRQWLKRTNGLIFTIALQCGIFLAIATFLADPAKHQMISTLREINRPLIIYWFGYIALGIACYQYLPTLSKQSKQMTTRLKIALLAVMALLMMVEYGRLEILTKNSIPPFDYVMFSCLLSVPILFLCFTAVDEQQFHPLVRRAVMLLSKYSLGIFCINGILSQIFLSFGNQWFGLMNFNFREILLMKLVGWILLLLVSLSGAILLKRVGLKIVVS